MAYPALAEKGVTPIFDEMKNQKLLKENIFAFYLTSTAMEKQGLKSDLTFGYYDKTKFEGEIHWNPIAYQYMFGVPFQNILFNGKPSNICDGNPNKCLITFDSGTSLMSMPSYATSILAAKGVPSSEHVQKCDSEKQFGSMAFIIGGQTYELSNKEWMFPPRVLDKKMLIQGKKSKLLFKQGGILGPQLLAQINHDDFMNKDQELVQAEADLLSGKSTSEIKACSSTIVSMDISEKMFLVGDVFMRKYYTIFDRDQNRVGLAKSKGYVETGIE